MYEEYFGLERPPFKITPDTSLFFEGGKRGDILAALVYAIHRGEGIIKVVGEVGSGKTMLCRMLQLKLPDSIEIVYIANPSVSPEDILFVIAHELSLPVTKEASKHEVMHQLHDYLLQRHTENKQVVLFIEEAQGMPLDTLEEIRLLSNLETDQNKLLQIILFGQPELDENLSEKSIRQLRERITHNFELDPLTPDEIHNYLNFRMRQVGYTGPELINQSVAKKIELHSAGLLRRINIIADKLLLSAFAEGTHNLGTKHVTAAVNDSAFNDQVRTKSKALSWLGLIAVVALAFGLYQTQPLWLSLATPDGHGQTRLAADSGKSVSAMSPAPDTPAVVEETPEPGKAANMPQSNLESGKESSLAMLDDLVSAEEVAAIEAAELAATEAPGLAVNETPEPATTAARLSDAEPGLTPVGQVLKQVQSRPRTQLAVAEAGNRQAIDTGPVQQPASRFGIENVVVSYRQEPAGRRAAEAASGDIGIEQAGETRAGISEEVGSAPAAIGDDEWLVEKLHESREWLKQAPKNSVSIQVMMRNKSAKDELIGYLRNEWPLDLSKTYLYETILEDQKVYSVFYSEFNTMTLGRHHIDQLPESIKSNSPYLNSVYRMRQAFL